MKRLLGEERGVALVITLLVVALMTTLIVEFDFRTRLDLRSAYNFRDNAQATVLADTGARVVSYILSLDKDGYDGSPKDSARGQNDTLWWEMSGVNGSEISGFPFEGGEMPPGSRVLFRVIDEGGKLNLNDLSYDSSELTVPKGAKEHIEIYVRLLDNLFGDDPDINTEMLVTCLVDRLDTNYANALFSEGCRHDYMFFESYTVTKGPLRTVDELRLVYGYTPEVVARLAPHVTVLPLEQAVTPGGTSAAPPAGGSAATRPIHKINVNTASETLLAPLHDQVDVGGIIDFRKDEPFRNLTGDLTRAHGGSMGTAGVGSAASLLAPLLDVKSDYFAIEVVGDMGDTRRTVRALLSRKGGTATLKNKELEVLWWRVE